MVVAREAVVTVGVGVTREIGAPTSDGLEATNGAVVGREFVVDVAPTVATLFQGCTC